MISGQHPSRRAFLKAVGAAGAAGAGAYSLKDTFAAGERDEPTPPDIKGRPFWVREVDKVTLGMGEMTEKYERFAPSNNCFARLRDYISEDAFRKIAESRRQNIRRKMMAGEPGWSLRDAALKNAANLVNRLTGSMAGDDVGIIAWNSTPGGGRLRALGLKYEEPPAVAARDVKAASRLLGAAVVGVTALDRRLVFRHAQGRGRRPIVFEDVEQPYMTNEKCVIPDSFKWVVVLASRMSPETMYRSPSYIGDTAATLGYSGMAWTSGSVAEFIRGLGYEAIPAKNGFCNLVAFGVLAGLGELGRHNRLITYEYGPMVRLSVVMTNLPMATDKPIDAGIAKFCRRCMKCAEACPSTAISFEKDPFWEVKGPWNTPGHKAWFGDDPKCHSYWRETNTYCGVCFAVCPWSKKDRSWVHALVKATAATAPAFDGVLRRMDDAFGYGTKNTPKEQEQWWQLELPEYGVDSMQGKTQV